MWTSSDRLYIVMKTELGTNETAKYSTILPSTDPEGKESSACWGENTREKRPVPRKGWQVFPTGPVRKMSHIPLCPGCRESLTLGLPGPLVGRASTETDLITQHALLVNACCFFLLFRLFPGMFYSISGYGKSFSPRDSFQGWQIYAQWCPHSPEV